MYHITEAKKGVKMCWTFLTLFFCYTPNSLVLLSPWTAGPHPPVSLHRTRLAKVIILKGLSSLWGFFDLWKLRYVLWRASHSLNIDACTPPQPCHCTRDARCITIGSVEGFPGVPTHIALRLLL